jgi:hypothetical protein
MLLRYASFQFEEANKMDEKHTQGILETIFQICKTKKLLLRSINLFYNW